MRRHLAGRILLSTGTTVALAWLATQVGTGRGPGPVPPASAGEGSGPGHSAGAGDDADVLRPIPQRRFAGQDPATGVVAGADGALSPFAHIPQTRDGMPFEDDPFIAESIEEQRWLDRNGFPNARQWAAYSQAPDGLLQQAAASGDTVAGVTLDARRLAQGEQEAAGRLMDAGRKGSLFAVSTLQAYVSSPHGGDPVLGYALGRLMEMKGDSRVAAGRALFPDSLSVEQRWRGRSAGARVLRAVCGGLAGYRPGGSSTVSRASSSGWRVAHRKEGRPQESRAALDSTWRRRGGDQRPPPIGCPMLNSLPLGSAMRKSRMPYGRSPMGTTIVTPALTRAAW